MILLLTTVDDRHLPPAQVRPTCQPQNMLAMTGWRSEDMFPVQNTEYIFTYLIVRCQTRRLPAAQLLRERWKIIRLGMS